MQLLKYIVARFPNRWQTELKRIHFGRQIKKGCFLSYEPEYKKLHEFITPGDWVVDIGANVGHYTHRFSELVGAHGRVIAFEPVPTTFSILSANVQLYLNKNVSLINAAVSDKLDIVGMSMSEFETGLTNYYEAHISTTSDAELSVLTIPLDSFCIEQRVALVKIDAEGHEASVISGMIKTIEKFHPVLIVETGSKELIDSLISMEYIAKKLENSPNVLFLPNT